MSEKGEQKQRRVKGDAYWKLQRLLTRLKEQQKQITEWEAEQAEKLDSYTDLINWNTGSIFEDTAHIVNGHVINGKTVARVPREIMKEHSSLISRLTAIDDELVQYRNELARSMGIDWPDLIAFDTGIIKDPDWDGIEQPSEDQNE